eukprot:4092673-Lingulodinium_polyedra.AAC.1
MTRGRRAAGPTGAPGFTACLATRRLGRGRAAAGPGPRARTKNEAPGAARRVRRRRGPQAGAR